MTEESSTANDAAPFEWAIVEIFGHRKLAGRTREEERFGAKMLRIDVPTIVIGDGDALVVSGWTTSFYGGASIFSFSLTDEATVFRANKPYAQPARITYQENEDDDANLPF